MTDINVGQLSEAINDKMDRDMDNQATGIHHIISTYVNGTSGYRIWDDGYCEQWGKYPNFESTSTGTFTISLPKTYSTTTYNILLGSTGYLSSSGSYPGLCISSQTESSYTVTYTNAYTRTTGWGCWKTCGYLASGQY